MRALILNGEGVRLVANHREPGPQPGEAVIRPLKVAISAMDVEVCRGLGNFTGVVGHHFVGVVESMNGAASADLIGRRVVGAPDAVCGTCDMCRAGLAVHCRNKSVLGRVGRDGCLADRFGLPARSLVAVPDDLDDDHAVFAVAVASGLQAARQLTIEGKPYVTVLGDGILGLLTVQILARLNVSVRLVGRHSAKLALCERWGIKHRHIDDVGRRADQDVVVDCTGTPEGLGVALQLVRPRGKILLKSLFAHAARAGGTDLSPLVTKEITLIGSAAGPLGEAVGLIARGEIDVISILGRRMRLDDGANILHAAAEAGALAVVVDV